MFARAVGTSTCMSLCTQCETNFGLVKLTKLFMWLFIQTYNISNNVKNFLELNRTCLGGKNSFCEQFFILL